MKAIYLLRHAKSSWKDPSLDDVDRPLNRRGNQARMLMANHMVRACVRPGLVLCSAAKRARLTVQPLVEALGGGMEVSFEEELYHASAAALLARLRRVDDRFDSVMLVGHSPSIEELATALAAEGDEAARSRMIAKFPTGSLASLSAPIERWSELDLGAARLDSFVRPCDLESG